MADNNFFDGVCYARDYILSVLNGLMNGTVHTSPEGENDKEHHAYHKVYDLIVNKFGDMFTEFKG